MQPDILAVLGDDAKFFAENANGRLHCNLTNIDVLPNPDSVTSHLHSRRFKAAKTEAGLKQFGEYIVPSPDYPDKLLCTLTGALINKNEDAVWKHMTGKKFERLLSQKEAEKAARKGGGATEPAPSTQNTPPIAEPSEPPPENDSDASSSGEDAKADDVEFWIPPPGARRDEDREAELAGGGEDVVMEEADDLKGANGHAKKSEGKKRAKQSKDRVASHRDKRTTKSVGPAENAPQKKKRRPQG